MARLTPAVVRPAQTGATVAMAAVTVDGDAIPPGAAVLVTNAGASPTVITIDTPGTVGAGLAIADLTVSVPAATTKLVGPFPEDHFRQGSGATKGLVHLNYSVLTSVTRAALDVSR